GTHTQYLVAYNTCGHWDVDSMDVVVNAIPSVSASTNVDTICGSGSANLLASGASSYVWTPTTGLSSSTIANPVATPSSTTTYTVVGTSGGCSNDASITIYVEQSPTASFIYTPSSNLCSGSIISFDANASINTSTFYWTFPGGSPATANGVNPSASFSAGSHTLKLVVENGCGAKDSTTSIINVTATPALSISASPDTLCAPGTSQLLATGATNYNWSPSTGLSGTSIQNPVATLSGTETYTVIGSNGACADTLSVEIYVYDAAVAAITYSPMSQLCDNVPITFDASTSSYADTYSWAFQNGTPATSTSVSETVDFSAGTQNIMLIVENACGDKDTTYSSITVNTAPQPTIVANDSIFCTNTTYTLDAGSGYSNYAWTGGTSTTNTLSISSASAGSQSYSVTVTDANGCSGTDNISITYIVCTEVAAIGDMPLSVYPNPAHNNVFIEGINDEYRIYILSADGRLVSDIIANDDISLNISMLSAGVYFLNVEGNNTKSVFRLVVE
ncbi:MAG: T9SS type A sorting domain-containing protein, partial [Bacteroidales bacterium]|nr:T9SS type A sorting domain-containing protein [Bacteroidales bacterium]